MRGKYSLAWKETEALFLDVAMGDMTPKRESKREWFMSPYI